MIEEINIHDMAHNYYTVAVCGSTCMRGHWKLDMIIIRYEMIIEDCNK